jgi:hypothetical protein
MCEVRSRAQYSPTSDIFRQMYVVLSKCQMEFSKWLNSVIDPGQTSSHLDLTFWEVEGVVIKVDIASSFLFL